MKVPPERPCVERLASPFSHQLTHGGARYFGLIHVRDRNTQPDDYAWVLGVRNSHDKRFLAGLVAGGHCFLL